MAAGTVSKLSNNSPDACDTTMLSNIGWRGASMRSKGWLWFILPLTAAVLASPLSAANTDLLQGAQPSPDVGADRDDYKRTFALDHIPTNPKL